MNLKIVSFQSCSMLCLDNDTAFGTCYRLRLLLRRKRVHRSVTSHLTEQSHLSAEQCEEARHRSWTPAALSASMMEKIQFPGFMFPQVVQKHKLGITNHHLIAYSLSNISAKNCQNRLTVDVRWNYSVRHQCHFLRHSVEVGQVRNFAGYWIQVPVPPLVETEEQSSTSVPDHADTLQTNIGKKVLKMSRTSCYTAECKKEQFYTNCTKLVDKTIGYHSEADVGLLERRSVVGPITGNSDHLTIVT